LDDATREILPSRQSTSTPKRDQEDLQQPRPGWSTAEPVRSLEGLLTARETEVLQAIANGASNAQIAANLNISLETVKTHVKNILQKLRARDRTQAVVIALRASLVSLPD
jgi:DNA-binding NarL/FixJ family response regulator